MGIYIAIDIGGTNTRISFFNSLNYGSEFDSIRFNTHDNFKKEIDNIIEVISKDSKGKEIAGIAIAIAMPITKEGEKYFNANLNNYSVKELREKLESKYGVAIKMINDASAGGLYEATEGMGKKYDKFTYLTWGTGIGGVTIEKKKNTYHIFEYEFGHEVIIDGGIKCNVCGKKGCLEKYVGGMDIKKIYGVDAVHLGEDKWDEVLHHLKNGIDTNLKKYPVENILVGGTIFLKRPDFAKRLEKSIGKVKLGESSAGDKSPIFGALKLLDDSIDIKIHKKF